MSLTRIAASWGAGIREDGVVDTSLVGHGTTYTRRVVNKWPLSGYSGALILGAWLEVEVLSIAGDVSAKTTTVGPYNGDGLADPEIDAGATAYTRCNVQSDNYAPAITDLRTVGTKTIALGAQAVADIQAAIASGTFALAIQGDGEPWAASTYIDLDEYAGANPPTLILEYEPNAFGGADYADLTGADRIAAAGLGDAGSFVAVDEVNYADCIATWSNDARSDGVFGDWTGHSIGPQSLNFRTVVTFDISNIAVGEQLESAWIITTTNWVYGNAADSYYLGPYNGDGAANPQTDGAALAYTRADCSADYYVSGDEQHRTINTHIIQLSAQAITDILAIRAAAGTLYTLALRQAVETGTQHYSTIEGWTMGAQAPKLRIYLGGLISSLVSTADHSNDVDQYGARGGWSGHSVGVQDPYQFRSYIRFPLAGFPTDLTVASAKLKVRSDWIYGNIADRYILGPYNGTGLGNPETDTGAQAFTRSNPTSDFYIYGDMQFTATGDLEWELGAQAVADLSAAITANQTYFSVALKQISESMGTNHYSTIQGFSYATPPTLTISGTAPPTPVITSVGSGTVNELSTGVVLTGGNLGTTKSHGYLELNSSANGSGTSVTQTDTEWSNTSITFNVVKGTLTNGTVYAIVHDNNGVQSSGLALTLENSSPPPPPPPPPPPTPVITGLSTTTLTDGKTGVVITGTNFGATQGAGYVELNTAADGGGTSQTQTITAWGDTSITFTVARGSLPYGRLYLLVHSDA